MKKASFFKTSFYVSIAAAIILMIFKAKQLNPPAALVLIAGASTLCWTITAFVEVYSSKRLNLSEKMMWTVGFLVLNPLAGLLYFLSGRKRVLDQRRKLQVS